MQDALLSWGTLDAGASGSYGKLLPPLRSCNLLEALLCSLPRFSPGLSLAMMLRAGDIKAFGNLGGLLPNAGIIETGLR